MGPVLGNAMLLLHPGALLLLCLLLEHTKAAEDLSEAGAVKWMKAKQHEDQITANKLSIASWNYESNITDANLEIKSKLLEEISKVQKAKWKELQKFDWKNFKDEDLKRQFKQSNILGTAALPDDMYKKFIETTDKMSTIYAKAKVCDFKNSSKCTLRLEPELTEIMSNSRNPEELKHYWAAWRDASGKKCRDLFKKYIELKKAEVKANGYDDPVQYWNHDFESDTFEDDVQKLWEQLEPFYKKLHAFVRDKLNKKYGDDVVSKNGPIPAHLLGNMWGQTWSNINSIVNPYHSKQKGGGPTEEMIKQGYTPLKMAKLAEDFFKSIGLPAFSQTFWEKSIFERPDDREIVCHASAWDFYMDGDVRIKMCTSVTEDDLQTLHHEMGHIHYFLAYKDQPPIYREGANSGFHEAIGDVIALNVATPKHLVKIGLKESEKESKEEIIGHLLDVALDKIAFLPFGFLIDRYRWDVLKGTIPFDQLEAGWWNLREKYQGLEPPVARTESDFDPAAKYHVAADVPYIRYFVSFVIQFQFYKALCIEAGLYDPKAPEKNPLHECDIYGNKAAGDLLEKVLKMGSSKPWQDAMEVMTGQREMDAGPITEYFKPLIDWLDEENKKNNLTTGWEKSKCRTRNKRRSLLSHSRGVTRTSRRETLHSPVNTVQSQPHLYWPRRIRPEKAAHSLIPDQYC